MLRFAKENDVTELANLYDQYFEECYPARSRALNEQDYLLLLQFVLTEAATTILVYELENALVALSLINRKFSVFANGSVLEITDLFVVPSARNRGIASELLHHAEKLAASQNITRIELYSAEANSELFPNNWYRERGYEVVGPTMRKNVKPK